MTPLSGQVALSLVSDEVRANPSPDGLVVSTNDVGERVRREHEIQPLASALQQTADGVLIAEADGRIAYVNPAFERMADKQAADLVGRRPWEVGLWPIDRKVRRELASAIRDGRAWRHPFLFRRGPAVAVQTEASVSPIRSGDGTISAWISLHRDVSVEQALAERISEEERRQSALAGALDQLAPGRTLAETADRMCRALLSSGLIDSVALFRLDPRYERGETLAYAGPPQNAVAPNRPLPAHRSRHFVSRAAAGPWVDSWQDGPDDTAYGRRLQAIGLRAVAYAPLRVDGDVAGLLALGTNDPAGVAALSSTLPLLSQMSAVAAAVLGPQLQEETGRADVRERVRRSMRPRAITPVFQPIVDVSSGEIVAFETLARFDDGVGPALRFEEAALVGLRAELETAALAAALEGVRQLPAGAAIHLNLSPETLLQSVLIRPLIERTTRPLIIEITENAPVADYDELRDAIGRLGRIGLAVDDAGAGFASFRHIIELRPQLVKIDAELVRGVHRDVARRALIAGLVRISNEIGFRLVAEGVEESEELDALRALGVHLMQGFLLGRPQGARRWQTRTVPSSLLTQTAREPSTREHRSGSAGPSPPEERREGWAVSSAEAAASRRERAPRNSVPPLLGIERALT